MLERIQLGHGRDQRWVLTLDTNLLLDPHLLAPVRKSAIDLIVDRKPRAAQCHGQSVPNAEARVRLFARYLDFERPDLEEQCGVENEEVEGHVRW